MKIASTPPISPRSIVQPSSPASQAFQHTDRVDPARQVASRASAGIEKDPRLDKEQHYSRPSMSTQDFLALRTQTSDDMFKELDELLARIKDRAEVTGDLIEAIKKMKEIADPDNVALQVLVKTLEGLQESQTKE